MRAIWSRLRYVEERRLVVIRQRLTGWWLSVLERLVIFGELCSSDLLNVRIGSVLTYQFSPVTVDVAATVDRLVSGPSRRSARQSTHAFRSKPKRDR